ncbi:MAG: DUF748 domain-containing protein [Candidatus Omnitrophica bacterium]|nr:DUF748 domain-containing protein [Candidatus Omnitrophota bacterium]
MKRLRPLKIVLIAFSAVVISVSIVFLLISMFGKTALEQAISKAIGFNIGFKSIGVDLDRYVVNLNDFCIYKKGSFTNKIFYAGKCTLVIDKTIFEKEKKAVIRDLVLERGILNLVKNRNGTFNLACNYYRSRAFGESLAYADTVSTQFYDFARNVKRVEIKNSTISFTDHHVPGGPFSISFDDFNLTFRSGEAPRSPTQPLNVDCRFSFKIHNIRYNRNSSVMFNGKFSVYPEKSDMDMIINTEYVDLMQFLPYFRAYTPFSFNSGLFSSNTRLQIINNTINSPTVMVFHNLGILIDEKVKNAQFLTTSVNKVAPYLTSAGGDIVFDFMLTGPVNNIKGDLGPTAKAAIGLAITKEVANTAQKIGQSMGQKDPF